MVERLFRGHTASRARSQNHITSAFFLLLSTSFLPPQPQPLLFLGRGTPGEAAATRRTHYHTQRCPNSEHKETLLCPGLRVKLPSPAASLWPAFDLLPSTPRIKRQLLFLVCYPCLPTRDSRSCWGSRNSNPERNNADPAHGVWPSGAGLSAHCIHLPGPGICPGEGLSDCPPYARAVTQEAPTVWALGH
jgi:hypothetical protein